MIDDLSFATLLETLRESAREIETRLRSLPADRWDAVVFNGENGWTGRQLLAHMAANDLRQITRVRVGAGIGGEADAKALAAQANVDGWNQEQVDARAGRGVDELLDEMRRHRHDLLALLERLTPEQRSREMPFRGGTLPLTAMAPLILGHLGEHAGQLAQREGA